MENITEYFYGMATGFIISFVIFLIYILKNDEDDNDINYNS